jgi:hypothetical protein
MTYFNVAAAVSYVFDVDNKINFPPFKRTI